MPIARIPKNGSKTCSHSSILGSQNVIVFKNQFTMQFQCPFWCFFNKHQNAHRFINNMYSGTRVQPPCSENVVGLALAKTNEILPFCCFARKYHRFGIMPDASEAHFLICAKTPSFKHAIYCCPNINNAIEQHFRAYSTKSREHPPCANMVGNFVVG